MKYISHCRYPNRHLNPLGLNRVIFDPVQACLVLSGSNSLLISSLKYSDCIGTGRADVPPLFRTTACAIVILDLAMGTGLRYSRAAYNLFPVTEWKLFA